MLVTGNVFAKKPVTTARLRRNLTTRQIRTEINPITNPTTALLVRKTSLMVLPTITITATTTSPQNRPLPQLPEIPLIPLLTNWEKTVNFPQTNGNAVSTMTFAFIVEYQVTRLKTVRKPQLPKLKVALPKSKIRTRTVRKKSKQPSALRTS